LHNLASNLRLRSVAADREVRGRNA
jgi:hypothetical protein